MGSDEENKNANSSSAATWDSSSSSSSSSVSVSSSSSSSSSSSTKPAIDPAIVAADQKWSPKSWKDCPVVVVGDSLHATDLEMRAAECEASSDQEILHAAAEGEEMMRDVELSEDDVCVQGVCSTKVGGLTNPETGDMARLTGGAFDWKDLIKDCFGGDDAAVRVCTGSCGGDVACVCAKNPGGQISDCATSEDQMMLPHLGRTGPPPVRLGKARKLNRLWASTSEGGVHRTQMGEGGVHSTQMGEGGVHSTQMGEGGVHSTQMGGCPSVGVNNFSVLESRLSVDQTKRARFVRTGEREMRAEDDTPTTTRQFWSIEREVEEDGDRDRDRDGDVLFDREGLKSDNSQMVVSLERGSDFHSLQSGFATPIESKSSITERECEDESVVEEECSMSDGLISGRVVARHSMNRSKVVTPRRLQGPTAVQPASMGQRRATRQGEVVESKVARLINGDEDVAGNELLTHHTRESPTGEKMWTHLKVEESNSQDESANRNSQEMKTGSLVSPSDASTTSDQSLGRITDESISSSENRSEKIEAVERDQANVNETPKIEKSTHGNDNHRDDMAAEFPASTQQLPSPSPTQQFPSPSPAAEFPSPCPPAKVESGTSPPMTPTSRSSAASTMSSSSPSPSSIEQTGRSGIVSRFDSDDFRFGSIPEEESSSSASAELWSLKERTIIIFDWDDTLCPSTWLNTRGFSLEDVCLIPREVDEYLAVIAKKASTTLAKAAELGTVVIVTNAEQGWIEMSCRKFLPGLMIELQKHKQLSARTLYETRKLSCPFTWKQCAFREEIFSLFSKLNAPNETKNILSFGDSAHERVALMSVTRVIPFENGTLKVDGALINLPPQEACAKVIGACFTKSIKLVERPTIVDLIQEHDLICNVINSLATHTGDLDLCIRSSNFLSSNKFTPPEINNSSAVSVSSPSSSPTTLNLPNHFVRPPPPPPPPPPLKHHLGGGLHFRVSHQATTTSPAHLQRQTASASAHRFEAPRRSLFASQLSAAARAAGNDVVVSAEEECRNINNKEGEER